MQRLLIGQKVKTNRGVYQVLRSTQDNHIVRYISGEWKGRYLLVPKEPVTRAKIETWKLSKHEMEQFLDLFWITFKQEFNNTWLSLRVKEGDIPTTKDMFEALRNEWAPLFQIVMQSWFAKR